MSSTAKIKRIINQLLKENGECTLDEIKGIAETEGMIFSPKDSLIRSTMYLIMKKDDSIERIGRGRYRKVNASTESIKSEDKVMAYLDEVEKEMLNILDELESFKWYQASDEEINRMRERGKRIEEFYENVGMRGRNILF